MWRGESLQEASQPKCSLPFELCVGFSMSHENMSISSHEMDGVGLVASSKASGLVYHSASQI